MIWCIGVFTRFVFRLISFTVSVLVSVPERVCLCVCVLCARSHLGVSAFGSGGCLLLMVFLLFVWKGRQDVRCMSARSRRWKAGEGVEVAECCSGNRLSQQISQEFSPVAFSVPSEPRVNTTHHQAASKNSSTPPTNLAIAEHQYGPGAQSQNTTITWTFGAARLVLLDSLFPQVCVWTILV